MNNVATIYGNEYRVEAGARIKPENWPLTSRLEACDDGFCPFRLYGDYTGIHFAVRSVEITGRTVQRVNGESAVRVKITFQGDGEPDTVVGGWYFLN